MKSMPDFKTIVLYLLIEIPKLFIHGFKQILHTLFNIFFTSIEFLEKKEDEDLQTESQLRPSDISSHSVYRKPEPVDDTHDNNIAVGKYGTPFIPNQGH